MAGVFSRDIWRLLFSKYLSFYDAVTFEHVSKRMREFMTDDQRFLINTVSSRKIEYRNIFQQRLAALQAAHKKHLDWVHQTEAYGKGVCTICGKIVKLSKISKHQRNHRDMRSLYRHDHCGKCGLERPKQSGAHKYTCGKLFTGLAKTRCQFCGLILAPRFPEISEGLTHLCPLVPYACAHCFQNIPFHVYNLHIKVCKRKCQHSASCTAKVSGDSGFCVKHKNIQRNRCQRITRLGTRCTRRATGGFNECSQHHAKAKAKQ
jgi:hypothetical protein